MSGQMVSWADYQGLGQVGGGNASMFGIDTGDGDSDFGGISSLGDIDSLNKALAAGSDVNNPGASAGEGFPLRVESLDSTLFNVTYTADKIKFWRMLYKDPAYNTIEEFNRLD